MDTAFKRRFDWEYISTDPVIDKITGVRDSHLNNPKMNIAIDDNKYNVYQIIKELDTYQKIQKGVNVEKKYDNPDLHNNIIQLNKDVKKYYEELIEPLLFRYELIK